MSRARNTAERDSMNCAHNALSASSDRGSEAITRRRTRAGSGAIARLRRFDGQGHPCSDPPGVSAHFPEEPQRQALLVKVMLNLERHVMSIETGARDYCSGITAVITPVFASTSSRKYRSPDADQKTSLSRCAASGWLRFQADNAERTQSPAALRMPAWVMPSERGTQRWH